MSVQETGYAFDGLPLSEVEPGTSVFVTGPALGGVRRLLMRMLLCRHSREGALFIAADSAGPGTLEDYASAGASPDPARVGVVDCTEEGADDAEHNIHAVGSPSDLTGVGIEYSSLYESLHANGASRVRTGVYTLSPFVVYSPIKPVFRFLHTLIGRIRTADGLGVCAVDPAAVEKQALSSLCQPFDGRIDLRAEDGETAIRVRGLADQPDGWQRVDL